MVNINLRYFVDQIISKIKFENHFFHLINNESTLNPPTLKDDLKHEIKPYVYEFRNSFVVI